MVPAYTVHWIGLPLKPFDVMPITAMSVLIPATKDSVNPLHLAPLPEIKFITSLCSCHLSQEEDPLAVKENNQPGERIICNNTKYYL